MERVIIEPGTRCVVLTPSDTDPINITTAASAGGALPFARKLRVTVTGNVSFVTMGGDTVSYTAVAAGTIIDWVSAQKLRSTGTTATVEGIY